MMSIKWKMGVEKLYENEDYLVVNKPYDMYINSDDENEKNTVTYHIASPDSHLSTSANPIHFIQRLDYSTSGVLCMAKNKNAAAQAGKLFENRSTCKYYLAIVRGHVSFEVADIEFDVGVDPLTAKSSHRMCALVNSKNRNSCVQSRPAHTRMLVLETGRYGDEKVTVVLLKPITGRRHQLRVHCHAIGHIILGDYTYSNATDITPHRMYLHATSRDFPTCDASQYRLKTIPAGLNPGKKRAALCFTGAIRLVIPLQKDPIDIQTSDPFFSDPQFATKWHPDECFYRYRNKEDFKKACEILDQSYVIGVRYKIFKYSET